LMRESLTVGEPLADVYVRAGTLCNLGHVERLRSEPHAARRTFREALSLFDHDLMPELAIWCLDGLASTPSGTNEAEEAAIFLGAAEALARQTDYQHRQTEGELRKTGQLLRDALGEERFQTLRDEGASTAMSTVIQRALHSHP
jgi:hypothetical protein